MAYVAVVISVPGESVAQLNVNQNGTNPHEAVNNIQNLLSAALAGAKAEVIQVTVRDTDPAVATHGTGSTQKSYSLA